MNPKEKIAHTIPLLREAHKHKDRSLMNDLSVSLANHHDL